MSDIWAMILCQQKNTNYDKEKVSINRTDPEMIQRTKSVDKDIKSVFVNMQIIFNLQWFNVQFFNFMMMQKQY